MRIRTPELTSLARSRLIFTSMTFDPSGSVSSRQACSAIAFRSTTEGNRRIEDVELGGRQVQQLAVEGDLAARWVQREPATVQDRRTHAARPSLQRSHTRNQFAEVEWLDEVVIRTRIEALDSVRRGVARGQHQDRGWPVIAPGPGCDLDTGNPRHPPVENGDIVLIELQLFDGVVATVDGVDEVPRVLQSLHEDLPQASIVFRDQDPHR